ncbi:MAG TPA: hypothetical protein DCG12_22540, partial [Planctomycetaceae bacterium]|nr:hypothetical protein [Planctomycetaceae bacterium]
MSIHLFVDEIRNSESLLAGSLPEFLFMRITQFANRSISCWVLLVCFVSLLSQPLMSQESTSKEPPASASETPSSAQEDQSAEDGGKGEVAVKTETEPPPESPKSDDTEKSPKTNERQEKGTSSKGQPDKKGDTKAKQEATVDQNAKEPSQTEARLNAIEDKLDKLTKVLAALVEDKGKSAGPTKKPDAATEPKKEDPAGKPTDSTRPQKKKAPEPITYTMKSHSLKAMKWRSLGPANMSGRVTDLEVSSKDKSTWWIATGGGGLLKTTNKGTTVEHQFDHETAVSIGAIASSASNPQVLWVGTGEVNPRNSVSYGNGVYKSTDGGKTFEHKGLEGTYQIGRILVHPRNPDVVYVGAQGRLYGTNEDRGVYKTSDSGKTWEKVFYLDERTGVIDMIMHPKDPDTLIVAMWDRLRDEFDSWPGKVPKPDGIDGYDPVRKWGPKAGLYKTTDGGKNWAKLSKGLPKGMTGRIGLDWQSKSPHTIYAIIDCEDIGKGPKPFACYLGLVGSDENNAAKVTQVMPDSPADKAGIRVNDKLLSADGQKLYRFDELLAVLRKKEAGERIQLTLQRGKKEIAMSPKLAARPGA